MSKLGPYLRGERPLLDFHDTTDHELVHRHAEGGAWTTVGRGRAGTLREDVQAPLFAHRPGDLVALLAHHGTVSAMWVATGERGLVAAGRVPSSLGPHGMDWLAAWEGEGAQGPAMLAACKGVPRALLVLAACDCVDLALPIMDALDGEPASALSVARAWARGEGRPFANVWAAHHVEECARKMDAERFIPSWAKRPGLVARAAAAAVDATWQDAAAAAASLAAERTAAALGWVPGVADDLSRALLGPAVRARIDLGTALRGRAGDLAP